MVHYKIILYVLQDGCILIRLPFLVPGKFHRTNEKAEVDESLVKRPCRLA